MSTVNILFFISPEYNVPDIKIIRFSKEIITWGSLVKDGKCLSCGSTDLTEARAFNLMFRTPMGPVENEESFAYLRPETAQHIFTSFKNVQDSTSRQIPFGIAQIGKAFRNEINPRNFIFRLREFVSSPSFTR